MKREIIQFTTEEAWLANRKQDITSTDVADLFGYGYSNYDELFNRKLYGLNGTFILHERSDWGKALEPCIAKEFARLNNWTIRKKTEYIRIPELRIGSSFDYGILEKCGTNSEDITWEELSLMEIKNVGVDAYKRDWVKGFSIEAPVKIELQVQTELLVSGINKCMLCVLVGGNQGIPLIREANKTIQDAILTKCAQFWAKIDEARK